MQIRMYPNGLIKPRREAATARMNWQRFPNTISITEKNVSSFGLSIFSIIA